MLGTCSVPELHLSTSFPSAELPYLSGFDSFCHESSCLRFLSSWDLEPVAPLGKLVCLPFT